MKRRPALAALALAAATTTAGCGVPLDSQPQIIERSGAADTTPPPTTPTTSAATDAQEVSVYFLEGDALVEARYPVEGTPDLAQALGFVLAGPADDLAGNPTSSIPPGTELLDASIRDRTARINLSGNINDIDGQPEKEAFAQLAFTALAFSDQVDQVRFLIEGRGVDAPTDTGNQRLVTASDYEPPLNPR